MHVPYVYQIIYTSVCARVRVHYKHRLRACIMWYMIYACVLCSRLTVFYNVLHVCCVPCTCVCRVYLLECMHYVGSAHNGPPRSLLDAETRDSEPPADAQLGRSSRGPSGGLQVPGVQTAQHRGLSCGAAPTPRLRRWTVPWGPVSPRGAFLPLDKPGQLPQVPGPGLQGQGMGHRRQSAGSTLWGGGRRPGCAPGSGPEPKRPRPLPPQNRLRRQDVGLKTQLDRLDRQISELQLDVRRTSTEGPDSDSRPSSGTRHTQMPTHVYLHT